MIDNAALPYMMWADTATDFVLWSINTGIEQARRNEGVMLEDEEAPDDEDEEAK